MLPVAGLGQSAILTTVPISPRHCDCQSCIKILDGPYAGHYEREEDTQGQCGSGNGCYYRDIHSETEVCACDPGENTRPTDEIYGYEESNRCAPKPGPGHGGHGHPCNRDCSDGIIKTCYFNFNLENLYSNESERAADGVSRPVLTYNGKIPGPPIIVCEDDTVRIRVNNMLDFNGTEDQWFGISGTTLHENGIPQINRAFADGVPFVSQCPTPPGETFKLYGWDKDSGVVAGTYYYHDFMGGHSVQGASGPIIVKERIPKPDLYDVDKIKYRIFLQEWYHSPTNSTPVSILCNGKGRQGEFIPALSSGDSIIQYLAGREHTWVPVPNPHYTGDFNTSYEVFNIWNPGKRYRFRIIGAIGENFPIRVSIENHTFTAIATDAQYIEPVHDLTALWVAGGERYDIVVQTKEKDDVRTREPYQIHFFAQQTIPLCSIAYLRYHGQTVNESYIPDCSEFELGEEARVLNPVPLNYSDWINPNNIHVSQLRSAENVTVSNTSVNTHYAWMAETTFNNFRMVWPDVPFLFQDPANTTNRCGYTGGPNGTRNVPISCEADDICHCEHVLEESGLTNGSETFEIILINDGGSNIAHPVHQHGGWYHVLGVGQYDVTTTIINRTFIIEEDQQGRLTRNYDSPPCKDTLQIPPNGYAILSSTLLTNPAPWLLHSHISYHVEQGMAMVIQVGEFGNWTLGPVEDQNNTVCQDKPCLRDYNRIYWYSGMPNTTKCVQPGDQLMFVLGGEEYDVNVVNTTGDSDYDNFDDISSITTLCPLNGHSVFNDTWGSYIFDATTEGRYYFYSGEPAQCSGGNLRAELFVSEQCDCQRDEVPDAVLG